MSANVPTFVPLKKTDYGSDGLGSQDALDKFFTQMNSNFDALKAALNGGIDFGNFGGEEWEITVKTPATDWAALTFANNWSAQTFAGAWIGGSYRASGGRVELAGLITNTGIPVADAICTFPAALSPSQLYASSGSLFWVLPFESNTGARWIQRVELIVASDGTSALWQRSAYVFGGAVGGANVNYASLAGISWPTNLNGDVPLSCFPISVRCKDNAKVKDVFLTAVIDQDQAANIGVAPGAVAWAPAQVKKGFPNTFTIKNIAGLALGRTYKVRGVVLYE